LEIPALFENLAILPIFAPEVLLRLVFGIPSQQFLRTDAATHARPLLVEAAESSLWYHPTFSSYI
jgi:hypothetical protein